MRHLNMAMLAGSVLFAGVIAGCGSSPALNKEPTTSAIRAAEEVGASTVPSASCSKGREGTSRVNAVTCPG